MSSGNLWVLTFALSNQYKKVFKDYKNDNGKGGGNTHNPHWVQTLCFMNACYAVVQIIEWFGLNPTTNPQCRYVAPHMHAIDQANLLNEDERKRNKYFDELISPLKDGMTLDTQLKNVVQKRIYDKAGIPLLEALLMTANTRLAESGTKNIQFKAGAFTGNFSKKDYFTVDGKQITAIDQLVIVSSTGFVSLQHEAALCFQKRKEPWIVDEELEFVDNARQLHDTLQNSLDITLGQRTVTAKAPPKRNRKSRTNNDSKTSAIASRENQPINPWSDQAHESLDKIDWNNEDDFAKDELAKSIADAMKAVSANQSQYSQFLSAFQTIGPNELSEEFDDDKWSEILGQFAGKANFHDFQARLKQFKRTDTRALARWPWSDRCWVRKVVSEETIPEVLKK